MSRNKFEKFAANFRRLNEPTSATHPDFRCHKLCSNRRKQRMKSPKKKRASMSARQQRNKITPTN